MRRLDEADSSQRRNQIILWACMIGGLAVSGIAFIYKVVEFLMTLGGGEVPGFADVPVTVYFAVAAGWLCLLVWCFVTGKFVDIEQSKWDMLRAEDEYERRGE